MGSDPLNCLKRKLNDDSTSITKRLCLAKNILKTHHFPTIPKEKILAEWLLTVVNKNAIHSKELQEILSWISIGDDLINELKSNFIQLISAFVKNEEVNNVIISHILTFLEHEKIKMQLNHQIGDFINIITVLLKYLKMQDIEANLDVIKRVFNHFEVYYKNSKKKLEIITTFLEGETIEIFFEYIDVVQLKDSIVNICQTLLFPITKKTFFALFLRTLLQKESIDELIEEKGDNMQSVLKVMTSFFIFPSKRVNKDPNFLEKFIQIFVSSFKSENQLIFAFYIIASNTLNLDQTYITPNTKLPPIIFENNSPKIKRHLFLHMLQSLIDNEIDVNVKLTDTLSGTGSRIEIKKNFSSFLQNTLMGVIKLDGKVDRTSLKIIKTALKLDPIIVEPKLKTILPPLMVLKKSNSNIESYRDMLNYLLEMMFKLNKGTTFLHQVLPEVKILLEACNTEQFELQLKSGSDIDGKIITGSDLMPNESIETYGRLTSELMYRQNKEILLTLQKEFEEYCLMMLEEGFVSPSIITLVEVLSSILCAFFKYNKMADHTVPQQIADDFWLSFKNFDADLLKRLGKCVLKLNYNPRLYQSFLKLSSSYVELKLLNIQYGNLKMGLSKPVGPFEDEAEDMSDVLTCLNGKEWTKLSSKIVDIETRLCLINLLSLKITTQEALSSGNPNDTSTQIVKSHLISELPNYLEFLDGNTNILNAIFTNANPKLMKDGAKILIKYVKNNSNREILQNSSISKNRSLLTSMAFEVLRLATKLVENGSNEPNLSKALGKNNFDMATFLGEVKNSEQYFENFTTDLSDVESEILDHFVILKELSIFYLDENIQLTTIYILLTIKNKTNNKNIEKQIDFILQSIFEMATKSPDIFKIFQVEYLTDFENNILLNLFTLRIKTSNPSLLIKALLETAVKKVKTNSEIVKIIVKALLSQQKIKKEDQNINCFSDPVFQMSCIILPIIAKEKRAITTSNFRTILAELQEKLHKSLLKSFKSINFENEKTTVWSNASNTDESLEVMATLNAMEAFSLTLSKYCECNDAEEIKNLDSLWNGLQLFVQNAINSISSPETKNHHVDASIQLLNVTLRYIKKLESHPIFENKDHLFNEIWTSLKTRLSIVFTAKRGGESSFINDKYLDEFGVTVKFLCETASIKCFIQNFVVDLYSLLFPLNIFMFSINKNILQATQVQHEMAKFLWSCTLKANAMDQKSVALSKTIYKTCRNLNCWIEQHCEILPSITKEKQPKGKIGKNKVENSGVFKIDDIRDLLKINLDILCEVIMSAKKIPMNYKCIDAIFELQHTLHAIISCNNVKGREDIAWDSFFIIYEGSLNILNSLNMARDEFLEDRWPCFFQCYRSLVLILCDRSSTQTNLDKLTEEKLADLAHSIEKLTQSISKKKTQISRLATYTIGDICSDIETKTPSRPVRQHLENSVALFLEATDSNHAMSFLKRALAGEPGQITMSYLYTMYKRYHKYTGNA